LGTATKASANQPTSCGSTNLLQTNLFSSLERAVTFGCLATLNPKVVGSIPTRPIFEIALAKDDLRMTKIFPALPTAWRGNSSCAGHGRSLRPATAVGACLGPHIVPVQLAPSTPGRETFLYC
jgi:hypothetical protein